MRRGKIVGPALVVSLAAAAGAQEPPPPPSPPPLEAPEPPPAVGSAPEFRWEGELKLGLRDSKDLQTPIFTPFPDRQGRLFQRTVDPGVSLELTTVNLRGEGEITSGVHAKVEVHVLDLYNRNPTSSDDRILVREAWLRFGDGPEPSRPGAGRTYVLVGLAPRFTKQLVRRLDSYGMLGTAVGRFEQPQVQLGARLGSHAYARASVGNGNPVFLRDTNALAGDNGTPDRSPGSPARVYETGLPILYDAKPADINLDGKFEWGAGVGTRFEREEGDAVDVLLWRFQRPMSEAAKIRGTRLLGDLDLLRGEGFPLPISGRSKSEWGLNLVASRAGFRLFGQYVDQDIAGLKRRGFETELAWIHRLPGLFLIKESPFLPWIQPAVRVSYIDNRFTVPRNFPSLSVGWDWTKYDFGLRVGLVRGVDLTVEYSRHNAFIPQRPTIHPDEWLATFRAGF
ncbi:MAG TPA: hypothetical protein VGL15_05715 [Vicinamibacteria bacterium]